MAEEIRRSERDRERYAKRLLRQVKKPSCTSDTGGDKKGGVGSKAARRDVLELEKGAEEDEEGLLVVSSLGVDWAELKDKEGALFEKLQAETLEMRQLAAAAEKAEEEMRAQAARKAAATTAALKEALSEAKRLKAEAEQREVLLYDAYF